MNDINQRGVGDCWFLSSVASLATRPERIAFVINKKFNETAWENQEDLVFNFFRFGKWKSYKGKSNRRLGKHPISNLNCHQTLLHLVNYSLPHFAADSVDNEYWVPYTEKAYAKRYKTYEAITGGFGAWGMTDLTGGIAIITELSWVSFGFAVQRKYFF